MGQQFDNSVRRALEKWPNVPACYGWLRLDRRGRWLIQDQAITHRGAIAFLGRNYAADEQGQWYVQNGPQRAYCTLDYTPWIYHLDGSDRLITHTECPVVGIRGLVIDDAGDLLCETEYGIGLLEDRDLARFIKLLDEQAETAPKGAGVAALISDLDPSAQGDLELTCYGERVPVRAMLAADIPRVFGFVANPAPGDAASTV